MRISVVIPVYNHARYIDACLSSIDAQDWDDLEIIVLDDGSKDDSWRRIEAFRFGSNRKVVRRTGPNRGAHATINQGLTLATGELLTLCNSDDFFFPDRLRSLAHALETNPQSDFAFSGVRYFDDDDQEVTDTAPYTADLKAKQLAIAQYPSVGFALLLSNVTISTGNFFFRRRLLEEVGGFRPYKLVHDWDFALRCLLCTEPIYVPTPSYGYRLHAANSFTSLMSTVASQECPELMRRFMKAACSGKARNPLCPSPRNWPRFFYSFLEEHGYLGFLKRWDDVGEPFYAAGPGGEVRPGRAALR